MNGNATLVAFYGEKPEQLAALIDSVQSHARRLLGTAFSPYPMDQVHATIAGLEGARDAAGELVNANYLSLRGQGRVMELAGCLEHLRSSQALPFTVRFGGFEEHAVYPFASRDEHPFARSFTVQDTRAVLMGWPVSGESYPATLGRLRRELEAFGVLHKYHASPDALDNDAFMVVGQIRRMPDDDATICSAGGELRAHIAGVHTDVTVDVSNLQIVSYVDPALPLDTSEALRLADADVDRLSALCEDVRTRSR
jgi:hypothetical protein